MKVFFTTKAMYNFLERESERQIAIAINEEKVRYTEKEITKKMLRSYVDQVEKRFRRGGNSQNFLHKIVRFFSTLKCFYRVVIHRK